MFCKKRVLENGLRILTIPLENTQTVTILVMTTLGSKNESKDINGISHFLEHMMFKGTKKRPSALKVSEPLDEVGGICNAFTSNEYTGYYVRIDSDYLDLAIDWISDIYLNSQIKQKEIDKERGVILEEINMYLDNPMSYIGVLWDKLLYSDDQPAGRSILGYKENIKRFQRKDFLDYYKNYNAKNTVICLSGSFKKGAEEKIIKAFEKIRQGGPAKRKKTEEQQDSPKQLIFEKTTDQCHLMLGVRACNLFDKEIHTQKIIANILGGNMSSRLFMKIREKYGMAYYVHTSSDVNSDVGSLYTAAGIDYKNIEKVIKIILDEYSDLKNNKISVRELQKAKECVKGRMSLSLETSDSLASFYTMQEIFYNKTKTIQEIKDEINKVTIDDIYNIANKIFTNKRLNLTTIGKRKEELKNFTFD